MTRTLLIAAFGLIAGIATEVTIHPLGDYMEHRQQAEDMAGWPEYWGDWE